MGKPAPDPFSEPFPEPEQPWPIDPRPAMKDLKTAQAEFRTLPPVREQTPQERNQVIFGIVVVVSMLSEKNWIDRIYAPPASTRYVTARPLAATTTVVVKCG